jgi:hypothetical protein
MTKAFSLSREGVLWPLAQKQKGSKTDSQRKKKRQTICLALNPHQLDMAAEVTPNSVTFENYLMVKISRRKVARGKREVGWRGKRTDSSIERGVSAFNSLMVPNTLYLSTTPLPMLTFRLCKKNSFDIIEESGINR